ncbi:unnamed protein product, partial [marine sediment metagenome]
MSFFDIFRNKKNSIMLREKLIRSEIENQKLALINRISGKMSAQMFGSRS